MLVGFGFNQGDDAIFFHLLEIFFLVGAQSDPKLNYAGFQVMLEFLEMRRLTVQQNILLITSFMK